MNHKIGIITLNGDFNYGNRLQLYATHSIYSSLDYFAEALVPPCRISRSSRFAEHVKNTVKKMFGRPVYIPPEQLMAPDRLEAFKTFSSLIPKRIISDNEISYLKSQYDFFSVGSDQVWNPYYFDRLEDWYFLQFARPEQRIALSPSIGLDSLDSGQQSKLRDGINGFARLSIREERGAELIQECSGMRAQVICDPTLVIKADDWRRISSNTCTPSGTYVFTYLLGGASEDSESVLARVTDNGQIPVVSLTDRSRAGEPPAGPAEFIDLIDHASHVVTDSFHAAVFSCILKTPLTIVRRGGTGYGMFSRLASLAHVLGIESKVCGSSTFDLAEAGNYDGIDARIHAERNVFMSYLGECIGA